jgi:hypothetical protein
MVLNIVKDAEPCIFWLVPQNLLGLGSVSSEQMESRTLDIVRAGLHWSLRMSKQMLPLLLMLQW